jgi:hypothetical protein
MRKLKNYCIKRSCSQLIKLTASAIHKVPAWRHDCSLILKNISGLNVHPVKFFEENKRSVFNWGSPREMPLYLYFTGASLAFYCTGAFPYSTGGLVVNIPLGLNFS